MATTNELPSHWAKKACEVIKSKTDLNPVIGIVLGSGMGDVAKSIENPCVRTQIWSTHELKYIIKSISGWAVGGVYSRRGSVFRMVSHTKAGVVEESRGGLPRPPRNSCVAAANR